MWCGMCHYGSERCEMYVCPHCGYKEFERSNPFPKPGSSAKAKRKKGKNHEQKHTTEPKRN